MSDKFDEIRELFKEETKCLIKENPDRGYMDCYMSTVTAHLIRLIIHIEDLEKSK